MQAPMQVVAAPALPAPNGNAGLDIPLTCSVSPPQSDEYIPIILAKLHPLLLVFTLLYLFPGLFSDPTAHVLVQSCQLDSLIDSGF